MLMGNNIGSLRDELRTDHRNMVLLLDLLESETGRFAASGEVDYQLLGSVMTYMAEYPDAVHHPREDRLYQHLKSLHPDIDESLQRVETDHLDLEQAGVGLRNEIEALAAGQAADRDALIQGLKEYAQHLRQHMYWEEQTLFALADELDEGHVIDTDESAPDPLFGGRAEKRFRRLLNRIQRQMVWDAQQYLR